MAPRKSAALELAVLGVLTESPLHGYELRKRLISVIGVFSTLSYGVLYPMLRSMVERDLISETDTESVYPKRNRIVYALTDAGRDRFNELVSHEGIGTFEDEEFLVRLALFGKTAADMRLRVLQGRRSRLEERLDAMRINLQKGRERLDAYTLELQQHGLDALEREVAWLGDMISREEHGDFTGTQHPPQGQLRPRKGQPKISTSRDE